MYCIRFSYDKKHHWFGWFLQGTFLISPDVPGSRRRYSKPSKSVVPSGGPNRLSTRSSLLVTLFLTLQPFPQDSANSSATHTWLSNIMVFVVCIFAAGDTTVRCEQLDMLQDWLSEFRKSTSSSSTANPEELVAFDVLCGDLNFDNCSSGKTSFAFPGVCQSWQGTGMLLIPVGYSSIWLYTKLWLAFARKNLIAADTSKIGMSFECELLPLALPMSSVELLSMMGFKAKEQ